MTTRTAGTDELLPGDDNAIFCQTPRPETIRAGLGTLLADPAARTRAENTRQNLCSHFTWQAVFATMMEAVTSAKGAKMSKLLIVIPAHNEEANIVQVVEELTSDYPQYDYVVVNDGSRDKTAAFAVPAAIA